MNPVNNSIACACALSRWWLPSLHDVSAVAGDMLPIMGVAYLSLQIVYLILKKRKPPDLS